MSKRGGGQAVKVISLNTGGLNATIKRTKVMMYIKNLNAEVIFLQETHLYNLDHRKFKKDLGSTKPIILISA